MGLLPFSKKSATVRRSAATGSPETFSNGAKEATIAVWEIYNSASVSQVSHGGRFFADEIRCVLGTHNAIAGELLSDDSVTVDGYRYSVQEIRKIKSSLSLAAADWEISLK